MASALTPRLLLRGFATFVLISVFVYGYLVFRGRNPAEVLEAARQIHWGWVLVGVGLASMDWIGGGVRNWIVVRILHISRLRRERQK